MSTFVLQDLGEEKKKETEEVNTDDDPSPADIKISKQELLHIEEDGKEIIEVKGKLDKTDDTNVVFSETTFEGPIGKYNSDKMYILDQCFDDFEKQQIITDVTITFFRS